MISLDFYTPYLVSATTLLMVLHLPLLAFLEHPRITTLYLDSITKLNWFSRGMS